MGTNKDSKQFFEPIGAFMKVLHLSHSCNRGGAETLLLNLCKYAIHISDLEFDVITDLGGTLETEFSVLLANRFQKWPRRGMLDIRYIFRLRRYLQHEGIHVVHTHTAGDALYAWLASRGLGIPIVDTHHGYRLQSRLQSRLVTRFLLPRITQSVFVSKTLLQFVESRVRKIRKTSVVYNGVHLTMDLNTMSKRDWRVPQGAVLVGMVGNLTNNVRDPMTVCKGLRIVMDQGVKFFFLFVGGRNPKAPEFFDQCVNYCQSVGLIEKHVCFLGVRDDVSRVLASLDGFVYSTLEDTFGIAVVEAALTGLPILVNDHPTMREVLAPFDPTYFRSADPIDFAEKFVAWVEQLHRLIEKSKKNAVLNKQRYSIHQCLDAYRSIYQELCRV